MSRKHHLWTILAISAGIMITSVVFGAEAKNIPDRIFYMILGYCAFWLLWARNL